MIHRVKTYIGRHLLKMSFVVWGVTIAALGSVWGVNLLWVFGVLLAAYGLGQTFTAALVGAYPRRRA